MALLVLGIAGGFGFLAADRYLAIPRPVGLARRHHETLFLCTVGAMAALTVHATLG